MRNALLAGCVLSGLAFAGGVQAQTAPVPAAPAAIPASDAPVGKEAGTIMVRLRAIGVLPQTSTSSVSKIGGDINATNQAAPEVDFSYFFTDNIAAELIAATTRHEVNVTNSALAGVLHGRPLDVGSIWVLPPTVTLQYHFFPKERFSPYLGAGLNVSFFYGSQPNSPLVRSWSLGTSIGPAIQAGFDYNFSSRWFLNFDVKQIFFQTSGNVHTNYPDRAHGTTVTAKTWLNPTVIGMGIGYRF
jgi:outer membrane protein